MITEKSCTIPTIKHFNDVESSLDDGPMSDEKPEEETAEKDVLNTRKCEKTYFHCDKDIIESLYKSDNCDYDMFDIEPTADSGTVQDCASVGNDDMLGNERLTGSGYVVDKQVKVNDKKQGSPVKSELITTQSEITNEKTINISSFDEGFFSEQLSKHEYKNTGYVSEVQGGEKSFENDIEIQENKSVSENLLAGESFKIEKHKQENKNDSNESQQENELFRNEKNEQKFESEGLDKVSSKVKKLDKSSKTHKTVKRSKEELKEIFSENQRILRETSISIPYHKPPQVTLAEFLSRRKKIALQNKHPRSSLEEIKRNEKIKKLDSSELSPPEKNEDEAEISNSLISTALGNDGNLNLSLHCPETKPESANVCAEENNSTVFFTNNEQLNQDKELKTKGPKQILKEKCLKVVKISNPKISGNPNTFIDLDEGDSPNIKSALEKFMEKFVHHTTSQKKNISKKNITIKIVRKEVNTESGKEELVSDSVTTSVTEKDLSPLSTTPGAKLDQLKQQLWEKLSVQRRKQREKRRERFELENEQGFKDESLEDNEIEEEELTDQTDTDEESDEGEESLVEKKKVKRNAFIDDEAEESGSENDEEYESDESETTDEDLTRENKVKSTVDEDMCEADEDIIVKRTAKRNRFIDSEDEESTAAGNFSKQDKLSHSEFVYSEVEENSDKNCKATKPLLERITSEELFQFSSTDKKEQQNKSQDIMRETSMESLENSFDFSCSSLPLFQPEQTINGAKLKSIPHEISNDEISSPHVTPSLKNLTRLSLPVEDSQDLYTLNNLQTRTPSRKDGTWTFLPSQAFLFSPLEEETNSKNETINKPPILGKGLNIDSQSLSQSGMDELLGLCSGQFSESFSETRKERNSQTLSQVFAGSISHDAANSQEKLDELIGLCSGEFTHSPKKEIKTRKKYPGKRRLVMMSDDEDDDCESFGGFSDNEINEDSHVEDNESQEEMKLNGFIFEENSKIRKEFIEEEAELSGSDVGSDEDLDLPEEEDNYEEDEIAEELPSEDELRDQIGRVHFKNLLDEDKRKLKLYQEMYLEDGDLHSEGGKRERKFRWKNIDMNSQEEGFGSESEDGDDDIEDDGQWRRQRHEREKWLKEQEELPVNSKDNTIVNRSKVLLKTSGSSNEPVSTQENRNSSFTIWSKDSATFQAWKGSFLCRDGNTLSRFAEKLKSASDSNVLGPRCAKKFVFHTVSPSKKSSVTYSRNNQECSKHPKKKCKLDPISTDSSQNSIFNFL
ncbi:claspin-like isoform X2 [Tachypleus tridentatus]|uniref:claspin-like isoform X2 n=1 Tax=Tachypleus tridentatus TaxID=6853 RepID=UPI003FD05CBB